MKCECGGDMRRHCSLPNFGFRECKHPAKDIVIDWQRHRMTEATMLEACDMRDIKMTWLCALALGKADIARYIERLISLCVPRCDSFSPLHHGVIELIETLHVDTWYASKDGVDGWFAKIGSGEPTSTPTTLNRAVVECVAKMQRDRMTADELTVYEEQLN